MAKPRKVMYSITDTLCIISATKIFKLSQLDLTHHTESNQIQLII